jgi:hypothetical protein
MNWIKVAQALDDEWHSKREMALNQPNSPDAERMRLLAQMAFMLRDCLVTGMSQKDRDKVFDRDRS